MRLVVFVFSYACKDSEYLEVREVREVKEVKEVKKLRS
jgi:hypothetical protein